MTFEPGRCAGITTLRTSSVRSTSRAAVTRRATTRCLPASDFSFAIFIVCFMATGCRREHVCQLPVLIICIMSWMSMWRMKSATTSSPSPSSTSPKPLCCASWCSDTGAWLPPEDAASRTVFMAAAICGGTETSDMVVVVVVVVPSDVTTVVVDSRSGSCDCMRLTAVVADCIAFWSRGIRLDMTPPSCVPSCWPRLSAPPVAAGVSAPACERSGAAVGAAVAPPDVWTRMSGVVFTWKLTRRARASRRCGRESSSETFAWMCSVRPVTAGVAGCGGCSGSDACTMIGVTVACGAPAPGVTVGVGAVRRPSLGPVVGAALFD
eukprot:PhM_4_TR1301/c1_g2_i1/m.105394